MRFLSSVTFIAAFSIMLQTAESARAQSIGWMQPTSTFDAVWYHQAGAASPSASAWQIPMIDAFGTGITQRYVFKASARNLLPLALQDQAGPARPWLVQLATDETALTLTEPDETRAEARRSEQALTADERKALQIALQWAGYYTAAIDGAFGRGTRASMRAWQEENGFEATGVLTTLQRRALIDQYNAVLNGLDLALVRDEEAGIEMMMPTAAVEFARYEPPFAHYGSKNDIGARVLLISQAGDQNTLFGLYEIMQTLEIVPLDGARERGNDSFELVGENDQIVSHTQVSLQNGQIKGFTLVWPARDEERRRRVLAEMTKSFTRLEAVLDPTVGSVDTQSIDLVSGLQIRQPKISRSGFFLNESGLVATTSETVGSCARLTIDGDITAEVLANDPAQGIALLRPTQPLSPLAVAALNVADPRLQSDVAVAGYSYEGVLSAATLTFGKLSDVKGLRGEDSLSRLSMTAQPGDVGGPVFDASGGVMGMLLPKSSVGPQLPDDVHFARDSQAIVDIAQAVGVELAAADAQGNLVPRDLRLAAQGMTVLVSCW
ncbi:MAG: serine protease [Pseudomonadota bacterium]